MAVSQLDDLFTPGADVLGTTQDANGTILAQTGDVVAENVASDGAEWWQAVGFISRPAKADAGAAACQAVTLNRGSFDLVVATRDLRAARPQVGEGETCVYAPGPHNQGVGRIFLQDDGTNQAITITVGTTQIVVKSDGSVTISASAVNLADASDFAALASKVDANFEAVATTFGTLTSSAGPVTAGTPFSPSSTAASKVKIS